MSMLPNISKLTPVQQTAIKAVYDLFDEFVTNFQPLMPEDVEEHIKQVIYAENVVKMCMEACFHKIMPFHVDVLPELGSRLVSLVVSATPPEQHAYYAHVVFDNFHTNHARRVAQGYVIPMNHIELPDKKDTN